MYSSSKGRAGPRQSTPANIQCQKCLKRGHYSYECNAKARDRPYVARPSRTQQLCNPALVPKLTTEVLDDAQRKTGVADQELAKKEAERARKRALEEEDERKYGSPPPARRSSPRVRARSRSYDSASSVSSRSPSPVPNHHHHHHRRRTTRTASPRQAHRPRGGSRDVHRPRSCDSRDEDSRQGSRSPGVRRPNASRPNARRSSTPPRARHQPPRVKDYQVLLNQLEQQGKSTHDQQAIASDASSPYDRRGGRRGVTRSLSPSDRSRASTPLPPRARRERSRSRSRSWSSRSRFSSDASGSPYDRRGGRRGLSRSPPPSDRSRASPPRPPRARRGRSRSRSWSSRSRSRSPARNASRPTTWERGDHPRGQPDEARRFRDRDDHRALRDRRLSPPRRGATPPPPPRERSLSPYSKRVAMSQGMGTRR